MNYEDIQEEESKTWLIEDPQIFNDKKQREIARYPMIAKQMGLNFIDTSNMNGIDLACGQLDGVSSFIPCRERHMPDPLAADKSKIG